MSSIQPSDVLVPALSRLLIMLEGRPIDDQMVHSVSMLTDFGIDSPALTAEHQSQLDDIVEFMLAMPEASIMSIVGRASQTGSEANNRALAFNRAETVRAYLLNAGIAPSRVGEPVSNGSRMPVIDIKGQEEELNRSVELWLEWPAPISFPAPAQSSTGSADWKLELSLSVVVSGKLMRLPMAGQFQLGMLHKLDISGTIIESKRAYLFMAGLEYSASFEEIKKLPAFVSMTTSAGTGGEIYLPKEYGKVDFDWFDGRLVVLGGFSLGLAGASGGGTVLVFPTVVGESAGTFYADIAVGFTVGVSGTLLVGLLNIED